MKMKKIGIIGAGNMVRALVKGMLMDPAFDKASVFCMSRMGSSAKRLSEETGICFVEKMQDLVQQSDIIMLGCKPADFETVAGELTHYCETRLIVSMMAGVKIAAMRNFFPQAKHIVRIMPNVLAEVGASSTGYCFDTEPMGDNAKTIMNGLLAAGTAIPVPEEQLDTFGVLFGCGVGFLAECVHAYSTEVEKYGITDPKVVAALINQMLLGMGMVLTQEDMTASKVRDTVATPGGLTEAGLQVMRKRGIQDVFSEAIRTANSR